MPIKKSKGNMYDWVSHVHSHLGGECPHKCVYCYVGKSRFGRPEKYTGPLRLLDYELKENYGRGRCIFVEHMNDLFADGVPEDWISRILSHCRINSENEYIFQTKNPGRAAKFRPEFPRSRMIGTTAETNRDLEDSITLAPQPVERIHSLGRLQREGIQTFITIEPIMDFDPYTFAELIASAKPDFVNIGADSKGCGLREPSAAKVLSLIDMLNAAGVTIKKKVNLDRLIGKVTP
jgi:DNA repair photolyase